MCVEFAAITFTHCHLSHESVEASAALFLRFYWCKQTERHECERKKLMNQDQQKLFTGLMVFCLCQQICWSASLLVCPSVWEIFHQKVKYFSVIWRLAVELDVLQWRGQPLFWLSNALGKDFLWADTEMLVKLLICHRNTDCCWESAAWRRFLPPFDF